MESDNGSLSDISPAQLDAGTVTIQSPTVNLTKGQYATGYYSGILSQTERYLWSGLTYPVTAAGGTAIGPFSVNDVTSVPTLTLTGLKNAQTVPVSQDLTLQWIGGDPNLQNGQITINAISFNQTQEAVFQCTAPLSAQTFTSPAWLLSALAAFRYRRANWFINNLSGGLSPDRAIQQADVVQRDGVDSRHRHRYFLQRDWGVF